MERERLDRERSLRLTSADRPHLSEHPMDEFAGRGCGSLFSSLFFSEFTCSTKASSPVQHAEILEAFMNRRQCIIIES